jgi:hypothetical protein
MAMVVAGALYLLYRSVLKKKGHCGLFIEFMRRRKKNQSKRLLKISTRVRTEEAGPESASRI